MPSVESELGTEKEIKNQIEILKDKIEALNIPLYDKNVEEELEKINEILGVKYKNFFLLKKYIYEFKNAEYQKVKDNYFIKINMMIDQCNICLKDRSPKNLKIINDLYEEAGRLNFSILCSKIRNEQIAYIKNYLIYMVEEMEYYKGKSYSLFEEKLSEYVDFERIFLKKENFKLMDILIEIIREKFRQDFLLANENNRIDKPDLFFNYLKNELIYWAEFLTPYYAIKKEDAQKNIIKMIDRLMDLILMKLYELKGIKSVQKYDLIQKFCLSFKEYSQIIFNYFKIKIEQREIAEFFVKNKEIYLLKKLDEIHENLVNINDMGKDYLNLLNNAVADINIYYSISTADYNISTQIMNYLTKNIIIFNKHFIEDIGSGKLDLLITILNNLIEYKLRLLYSKYKLMMIFQIKDDNLIDYKSIDILLRKIIQNILSYVKYDFEDVLNLTMRYEKLNNREEENIVDEILRQLLINFTFLKNIPCNSYKAEFKYYFLNIFNQYTKSDIPNLNEVGENNLNLLILKFKNEIQQI